MIQRGRREARPLPSAVAQCRSAVAQCRSERGLHVDDVACEVGRKTEIHLSKKLWWLRRGSGSFSFIYKLNRLNSSLSPVF